ncbi:hypothetical protein CLV47_108116 [Antricoccus suffuscus]|uniref:Uncharacterized protein n=1 Tax=Antricoccus suffuscus TaxID=1629062 RepID=A0A2T0ZZT6_9ACTN|nr:hypothetical protein [Antricoccus suffuscus]PRZ41757.1 hypothetical protein CLV47_108116 [Antricoccus suffuscus]
MRASAVDSARAVVLPVGQYLGATYDADQTEPGAHLVRMGWQEGEIVDQNDVDLWHLAHGAWSGQRGRWTMRDLVRAADDIGITDFESRLSAMCRIGLVVVLGDSQEMTDFAKSHRLHALMAGLGASDADDRTRSLGIVGQTPIAVVDEASYDFWQWGPLAPDIWTAATTMFHRPEGTAQPHLSRESHLSEVLGYIQMLVSRGVAYVDRVAPSIPPQRSRRTPVAAAEQPAADDHGGPE